MSRLLVVAFTAFVLAGLGLAGSAKASVVSVSFVGTIETQPAGGIYLDTYGYFGAPGSDITGKKITGSYTYDTSKCPIVSYNPSGDLCGGSNADFMSVWATINRVTITASTSTIDPSTGGSFGEIIFGGGCAAPSDTFASVTSYGNNNNVSYGLCATQSFVSGVTINAPITLDPTQVQGVVITLPDGSNAETIYFAAVVPEPGSAALFGAFLSMTLLFSARAKRLLRK